MIWNDVICVRRATQVVTTRMRSATIRHERLEMRTVPSIRMTQYHIDWELTTVDRNTVLFTSMPQRRDREHSLDCKRLRHHIYIGTSDKWINISHGFVAKVDLYSMTVSTHS